MRRRGLNTHMHRPNKLLPVSKRQIIELQP